MKKTELRIGNLVLCPATPDEYNEITAIGNKKDFGYYVELKGVYHGVWIEHNSKFLIKPIPLTEEWLLKLGLFKITKKEDLWGNDEIGVYDFNGKIRWSDFFITSNGLKDFTLYVATIDDGMESAEYLNNIIYVHQLQNLYFALTGEELTITE